MRFGISLRAPAAVLAGLILVGASACAPVAGPDSIAVQQTTPDRTVMLTIQFGFGSHRIRPESFLELNNLAAAMQSPELAGYRFQIDGHTDRVGRFGYNVALSRLRADAVRDYLASQGVSPGLMFAQGFGYTVPADAANPFAASNRRVEVTSIR